MVSLAVENEDEESKLGRRTPFYYESVVRYGCYLYGWKHYRPIDGFITDL